MQGVAVSGTRAGMLTAVLWEICRPFSLLWPELSGRNEEATGIEWRSAPGIFVLPSAPLLASTGPGPGSDGVR